MAKVCYFKHYNIWNYNLFSCNNENYGFEIQQSSYYFIWM